MMRKFLLMTYLYYVNCFTHTNTFRVYNNMKNNNICKLNMQDKNDKNLFNKLDLDKSGYLDINELKNFYDKNDIENILKGDINSDNVIDYPEFERLSKIDKFGKENGGNLYVRNAIKFGLLNKDSILADGCASILVGNKGFDPLNCATDINILKKYREAEIKHGRLAMLGSVGWPISELFHPNLSKFTKSANLLSNNNKVPSILNGGLEKINPLFFMSIIVFTATVESISINNKFNNYFQDKMPGDLGFDPLKLYVNKDPITKRDLELKELNNGRLAMIAITYYALTEFINNNAIINRTPYLFKSFL